MAKKKQKYRVGDIVGVCGGAMYEFRITSYSSKQKLYAGKCVRSYTEVIKVGEMRAIKESQIVVRLGSGGKYYDDVLQYRKLSPRKREEILKLPRRKRSAAVLKTKKKGKKQ